MTGHGWASEAEIVIEASNPDELHQNGLGLRVSGNPGFYEIYSSTDSNTWMYSGLVEIEASKRTASFSDVNATDFGNRFYKLQAIDSVSPTPSYDTPIVGIQSSRSMASEYGEIPAIFFISRSKGHTGKLTVGLEVFGQAQPDKDYSPIPNSVTIPAGQSNVKLYVYPKMDGISEGDESIQLSIEERGYYQLSGAHSATAWISDYDYLNTQSIGNDEDEVSQGTGSDRIQRSSVSQNIPNIQLDITQTQVEEGASDLVMLVLTRQGNSRGELPVSIGYSGSAIPGNHFGRLPSHLRFSSDNNVLNIPIFIIDDAAYQGNSKLVVKLNSGSGYKALNPSGVQLEILDNDPDPNANTGPAIIVDAGDDTNARVGEWIELAGSIIIDGTPWIYSNSSGGNQNNSGSSGGGNQQNGETTPDLIADAGGQYTTTKNQWLSLNGVITVDGKTWNGDGFDSDSDSTISHQDNQQSGQNQGSVVKVPFVEAGENLSTKTGQWLQLNASVQIINEAV